MYLLSHEILKEVSIKGKTPKSAVPLKKNFWGNLALGSVTLLSGINTESNDESLWMSERELSTVSPAYTIVYLYQSPIEITAQKQKKQR